MVFGVDNYIILQDAAGVKHIFYVVDDGGGNGHFETDLYNGQHGLVISPFCFMDANGVYWQEVILSDGSLLSSQIAAPAYYILFTSQVPLYFQASSRSWFTVTIDVFGSLIINQVSGPPLLPVIVEGGYSLNSADPVIASSYYQDIVTRFGKSKFYQIDKADFVLPHNAYRQSFSLVSTDNTDLNKQVSIYDGGALLQISTFANVGVSIAASFSILLSTVGLHDISFMRQDGYEVMHIVLAVKQFAVFMYAIASIIYNISLNYNAVYANRVLSTAIDLSVIGSMLQVSQLPQWSSIEWYRSALYSFLWARMYTNSTESLRIAGAAVSGTVPLVRAQYKNPRKWVLGGNLLSLSGAVLE